MVVVAFHAVGLGGSGSAMTYEHAFLMSWNSVACYQHTAYFQRSVSSRIVLSTFSIVSPAGTCGSRRQLWRVVLGQLLPFI
jgi:hypothetical protein